MRFFGDNKERVVPVPRSALARNPHETWRLLTELLADVAPGRRAVPVPEELESKPR